MKKRSISQKMQKRTVKTKRVQESVTIGMDLGDRTSRYCILGSEGEILREGQVQTSKAGMMETFGSLGRARIAIEVGTHSPWVSRLLRTLGHEIIVANPRQVKLITESSRKDDRLDACVWQLLLAHFGSFFWPTLEVNGFRLGRKAGLA